MELSQLDQFEWDESNTHKVSKRMPLVIAESAFLGSPLVKYDDLHSDTEDRWILVNRVESRYVVLVYTVRKKKIRIISARYMHKKESKKYEKEIG